VKIARHESDMPIREVLVDRLPGLPRPALLDAPVGEHRAAPTLERGVEHENAGHAVAAVFEVVGFGASGLSLDRRCGPGRLLLAGFIHAD